MRTRGGAFIALAMGAMLTITSCASSGSSSSSSSSSSSGEAKSTQITIGFVEITEAAPVVLEVQKELIAGATALGWQVKTVNANGDPAQMAAGVSAMVNQGVDALITLAIQPAQAAQGLAAAKAKGIPTIILGAPAIDPQSLYDVSYAPDDAKLATMAAEQMVKDIGSGDILEFDASGQPAIEARSAALAKVLEGTGVTVVATHETDLANGVQDTQATISSTLRAKPQIKAVWASQDFQYAPAVQTILNQKLGDNAGVYSVYLSPQAFPILRAGKLPTAIADSPLRFVAWYALDSLVNKFALNKTDWITPTSVHELPYVLVTHENVPAEDVYPYEPFGPWFEKRWADEGVKVS